MCSCGWQPEWPTVDEVPCPFGLACNTRHSHLFSHNILHYPFHNYTFPRHWTRSLLLSLACAIDDVVAHSFPFRHRQRRTGAALAGCSGGKERCLQGQASNQASRAGCAGRWIWQVLRAAVLAAQEGQRTRGATTDLDGCDRESILIVFIRFHLCSHHICNHINASHLHHQMSGGRCRRLELRPLMPPARLVLAPASVTCGQVQAGTMELPPRSTHHGRRMSLSLRVATSLAVCY